MPAKMWATPAGCIVNGTAVQKNDWSAHCGDDRRQAMGGFGIERRLGTSRSITRHISAESQ